MAKILKGAPVAEALTQNNIERVEMLNKKGITPSLAVLRVGEKEDDIAYERGIEKRCEKTGIEVKKIVLPSDVSKADLLDTIDSLNSDNSIHGVLMFRPLSDKKAEEEAAERLDPKKDVDGMGRGSLATVFTGKGDGYAPCTAAAVMELLKFYGISLSGKDVCVIGRSLVIGKPVSMMLQSENATVTMCHTKTNDLPGTCKNADILVVCAGKERIVDESFVGAGQVVIDVGINVDKDGKLCGDVDFDTVEPVVSAITPVPAGVGSVTTAVLCKHVIDCAESVE